LTNELNSAFESQSVDQLIDVFVSADTQKRQEIMERVDVSFRFVFSSYARRAAEDAIRRNDPTLLKRGLIALAISSAREDWRDTLPYLTMLHRSACKLHMDTAELFHETAQTVCPTFRKLLEVFIDRNSHPRPIESYHYHETGEGETFSYVYVEPPYVRPSRTRLRWNRFKRRLLNFFQIGGW
jgi:hypothetical protein